MNKKLNYKYINLNSHKIGVTSAYNYWKYKKGGVKMNDKISPVYVSQSSSNAPASHPVFDWSESAITANGQTLTIIFPDEDKPIESLNN